MKKALTLFLKLVVILIALGILFAMIRFPMTEGRAANLDLVSIYLDPVIWYMYIASIPFFVGFYHAIKLLSHIEHNKAFSKDSVRALQNIKYCVLATIGFIIGAEVLLIFGSQEEDKAGPIALGIYTTFLSLVILATVSVLQKVLKKTISTKKTS